MSGPQPVQLWTTKKEQESYENYADLYAIIKTVEKLEKARAGATPPRHAGGGDQPQALRRRTCATR